MTDTPIDLVPSPDADDLEIVDAEIVEEDALAVFGPPDGWHGIIHGLPEEAYHSHPALSSTQVKWLLDSPGRYRYNLTHPQPYKKAFDEGSAVHALVLGTGWEVVEIPDDLLSGANRSVSSEKAKAWVAAQRAANRIPLKAHEIAKVNAIAEAVRNDPDVIAEGLLSGGRPEVSVFATDPGTGVDMRCRFDYLEDDLSFAVDLKTMAGSATKAGFSKAVADMKYDVSHEHYLDTLELATGVRPQKFYIAVEKEPPYFTGVFRLSDDEIEMGRKEARAARRTLAASRLVDYWPHRPSGIQTTEAPMRRIYDHIDRFKETA